MGCFCIYYGVKFKELLKNLRVPWRGLKMNNKENNPQEIFKKREKKNQQRTERIAKKFPSQDDFFDSMVSNALRPIIFFKPRN
jgi:hypothetical protein